ncbi:MAG: sigma-54-dependent Fis family transcriptional regulator [Deltaproteobacteria bacterium]|nr:sigma-54-dependent Fis family transcriptional regulator [Deltaproteobacteria bacterium]
MREGVLVVDDDGDARASLTSALQRAGHLVAAASELRSALDCLVRLQPSVVLASVHLAGGDGLELLRRARAQGSNAAFVMLGTAPTRERADAAARAGAMELVEKPLGDDAAVALVERALEWRRLRGGVLATPQGGALPAGMVGESAELRQALEVVRQAAATRATVLILGESGTGKELLAYALHQLSPRSSRPFVKLNCAALPDSLLESELFGHERGAFTGAAARKAGRFERADGGTLLLDEIGDVPPSTQVKLLRVLQQREFERVGGTETLTADVRLVAATNRDLAAEVAAGRFREDLYYRLNVVTVSVPPLRHRKADIPALAARFLSRFSAAYGKAIEGLAPDALDVLMLYDWPGNVRELENAMERAAVLCRGPRVGVGDLPPELRAGPSSARRVPKVPGATLYEIERHAILSTLEAVGGSTSRAAAVLGVSVRKIQYKLREYEAADATPPEPRPQREPDQGELPLHAGGTRR